MDWLNQATAALTESKQSNKDWERRRNTDFALEFNRPSSLTEIDSKFAAKTAQLDGMTTASKLRRDAEEEVNNVERVERAMKKKEKKAVKEGTPTKLGKLPAKSMEEFKMEQQVRDDGTMLFHALFILRATYFVPRCSRNKRRRSVANL